MEPLQSSAAVTDLEAELKDLFLSLYEDSLKDLSDDINVYGVPHLGSFSLIERNIDQDGLAVLRETTEDRIRYLYKSWRHLNPERGLHFLRTYLRMIWSGFQSTDQLWQKKSEAYPTALKTRSEISFSGEPESDYFLTSRIRVDLDSDLVPERIAESLRSALAARFVLNLRIAKFTLMTVGTAQIAYGANVLRLTGDAIPFDDVYSAANRLWHYANYILPDDLEVD